MILYIIFMVLVYSSYKLLISNDARINNNKHDDVNNHY